MPVAVQVLLFAVQIICSILTLILWARFILDWVLVLNPRFRPRGVVLFLCEGIFTLTDPAVKFVRKFIPPLNLGQIRLDVSLMVLIFALWIIPGLLRILLFALIP